MNDIEVLEITAAGDLEISIFHTTPSAVKAGDGIVAVEGM
jgi:hypothetical protein